MTTQRPTLRLVAGRLDPTFREVVINALQCHLEGDYRPSDDLVYWFLREYEERIGPFDPEDPNNEFIGLLAEEFAIEHQARG